MPARMRQSARPKQKAHDRTVPKQASEGPGESEARFRAIAELSGDWYWEQDANHRFTWAFVRGGSAGAVSSIIGKTRWELGEEPLNGTWEEHRRLLDARQPFSDFHVRLVDENGAEHFFSTSGVPTFDSAGIFTGYRGLARRITKRKRAEQLLWLEHTVARSVTEADSVAAALKAVIRAVCEAEDWECGRFFRVDDEAGALRFAEAWSKPGPQFDLFIERSRKIAYIPGVGLTGKVWQSGEPIWIADITRDARVWQQAIAVEAGIHGAFVFPVNSGGKTIGVLAFNSSEIREPDERLMQAIHVIGAQIGQFVQRKQAEEVLRESEERFRNLTELSSDWYWEQDENFRFTMVSDNLRRRLGPVTQSVIGKARWELPTLNMTEADWAAHRALLKAHQPFRDLQWHRLDNAGKLQIASISGKPIFDSEGRFRGYRGIGRDITESRRSEEALLRFRASMDMSDDMILLVDRKTMRFVDVNETVCRNLGYSREAFLAMTPADILPVTLKELETAYDEMIATASTQGMRSEYLCKDGSKLPFESRRRVMRSGDSWIIVVTARDIRERIAREEALRKSNERFDMAVRATNDVIWDWDLITDEIWWNENFTKVFGHPREPADRSVKSWYEGIHPDDQGRVIAGVHRVIGAGGGSWGEETRFGGHDGSFVHVLDRGQVILDGTGRAVRMIGAMADISSRKQAEERIHNQALRQRLIAEFGQQAFASSDVEDVLARAVELVTVALKADFCTVLELDESAKQLLIKAASGWPSEANILAVAIERRSAEERLERLAQFDSLTGLPNRHLFHDRLLKTVAHARRSGQPMAVLFIDLDRFKLVNDTQGHSAGDKLLKEAAVRLSQCVRSGDTVGRFGGDEFGAIVSDLAKPGDAGVVAQKVLDALARPFKLDSHDTYVSASIGITLFPADGDNPEALVMNADTAMYRAKEQVRNTYQYFTREMNERALARVRMEAALRRAIDQQEFLLHYQPKVALETRLICGFEALLRWRHPEKGLVLPGEFVSVLEDTGLIVPVGERVLREVCAQIQAWQRDGLAVKPVTVNLSARQFQQKDCESIVRHMLRGAGVDPSLVQFELTESLLMSDPEGAARTLRGLKDSGVKISVDDFGTGYSSLAYLKRFPIDALKIDHSFIRDITTDPEDAMITLAIIGLAHSLKLKVVAEGVETQEQLELLAANGCDEIQGYYFSIPTTAEECEKMLRENRRLV